MDSFLFKLTYGLYVVSSKAGDKINGFISNTVFQVTAEPAQLAVTCSKNNFTTALISESKKLSISVLQKDTSSAIIGTFGYHSGKDIDKFSRVKYTTGKSGVPILTEDSIAWFECMVEQTFDVGTHVIFIAKIIDHMSSQSDSEKYKCSVCGYIYDPEYGDDANDIQPGVSFKELPDNYVCPLCGADKSFFTETED